MKKLVTTLLLSLVVLVGCQNDSSLDNENNQNENDENELNEQVGSNVEMPETNEVGGQFNDKTATDEIEPIKLHMLPADEDAGFTVENSEFYKGIQNVINQDPTIGAENDFTLRTIDILNSNDGQSKLIALGINRLDVSLKNMTFNLTLGDKSGDNILENEEVILSEEQIGTLKPNSAVPILFVLSDEQVDRLLSLEEGDLQVIIEDFDAETVE